MDYIIWKNSLKSHRLWFFTLLLFWNPKDQLTIYTKFISMVSLDTKLIKKSFFSGSEVVQSLKRARNVNFRQFEISNDGKSIMSMKGGVTIMGKGTCKFFSRVRFFSLRPLVYVQYADQGDFYCTSILRVGIVQDI